MNIGLPMIHVHASSSALASSSCLNFPVSVSNNIPPLKQPCTASCGYRSYGSGTSRTRNGDEVTTTTGLLYDVVFGPVTSKLEVEIAIASLQKFVDGISLSDAEFNRLRRILECYDLKTFLSRGYGRRVRDAFCLLRTDPAIKRLVASLSSDKAVWDAVMNNEVIRKLQDSCFTGENRWSQIYDEEPDIATRLSRWIMGITNTKVTDLIQKFQLLLNNVFQPHESGKEVHRDSVESSEEMDDKIRSSLLLSILILLIVVVARAHRELRHLLDR